MPSTHLLVLDDWLRDPLTRSQAQDLLEILDDRYGRSSTLVATQIPVTEWHVRIPDPTIGDAILDRLVHNAYRLELQGESRRQARPPCPCRPLDGIMPVLASLGCKVDGMNRNQWTISAEYALAAGGIYMVLGILWNL